MNEWTEKRYISQNCFAIQPKKCIDFERVSDTGCVLIKRWLDVQEFKFQYHDCNFIYTCKF